MVELDNSHGTVINITNVFSNILRLKNRAEAGCSSLLDADEGVAIEVI